MLGMLRVFGVFGVLGVLPILGLLRELPIRRLLLLPLLVAPGQPRWAAQGMLLDLHGPMLGPEASTGRAARLDSSLIPVAK